MTFATFVTFANFAHLVKVNVKIHVKVNVKASVMHRESYLSKGQCFVRMRENDMFFSSYKALSLSIGKTLSLFKKS